MALELVPAVGAPFTPFDIETQRQDAADELAARVAESDDNRALFAKFASPSIEDPNSPRLYSGRALFSEQSLFRAHMIGKGLRVVYADLGNGSLTEYKVPENVLHRREPSGGAPVHTPLYQIKTRPIGEKQEQEKTDRQQRIERAATFSRRAGLPLYRLLVQAADDSEQEPVFQLIRLFEFSQDLFS